MGPTRRHPRCVEHEIERRGVRRPGLVGRPFVGWRRERDAVFSVTLTKYSARFARSEGSIA